MSYLKTLLRSVSLRPRLTADAGEESSPLLSYDEKNGLQAKEETCPPLPPKEKEKPRARSRSEKNPTKKELFRQTTHNTERMAVATERSTILMKRFLVTLQGTAKLFELIVAHGSKLEVHDVSQGSKERTDEDKSAKVKREACMTLPPEEKREPGTKSPSKKFLTKKELFENIAKNTKRTAVFTEQSAVFMERSAVAMERIAELLELIVARGEEMGLLHDVLCSSKERAYGDKLGNVVYEGQGKV